MGEFMEQQTDQQYANGDQTWAEHIASRDRQCQYDKDQKKNVESDRNAPESAQG